MDRVLGVGMLGYGFIGKVHAYCYKNLGLFYDPPKITGRLVGVCTKSPASAQKGVEQAGFEFGTTRMEDLLQRSDIQVIHICTPNDLHKEEMIAALEAGKHVYCDKPLARTTEEALEIEQVARKHPDCKVGMTFQYRHIPALLRARELVDQGFIGRPLTFRIAYLHSGYVDPQRPLSWRLSSEKSGGGALLDLGSHVLDLLRFLLGEVSQVSAASETFVKERPVSAGSSEKGPVKVDDHTLMILRMCSGALGTLEASRVATGMNDEVRIEIHGDQGALMFNGQDPNWLYVYDSKDVGGDYGGSRGFKKIEALGRYPKPAGFPGEKFSVGWLQFHIACLYAFLCAVADGREPSPSLDDGVKAQRIASASQESHRTGQWASV